MDLERHNERGVKTRKYLKQLNAHFQTVEEKYRSVEEDEKQWVSRKWCSASDHAIITHQKGMIKVDLPYFTVTASSNIKRFKYDFKGHVNTVKNEAIVFSDELCPPSKTSESIKIDAMLRCSGETVKCC